MGEMKYKVNDQDDNQNLNLAKDAQAGYGYNFVANLPVSQSFSQSDWSSFLHISERTIIRYREQNKTFDPLQTDRIIVLNELYKFGLETFGNEELLNRWLTTKNLALSNKTPKELLITSFGIRLVKDEIGRIAHGVLA